MRNLARPNPFTNSAALGDSQVVVILKIEPKLRRYAEVFPQANGGVGADGPVSPDDFIDARKTESVSQRIAAQAQWFHELGLENLPRLNRKHLPRSCHGRSAS